MSRRVELRDCPIPDWGRLFQIDEVALVGEHLSGLGLVRWPEAETREAFDHWPQLAEWIAYGCWYPSDDGWYEGLGIENIYVSYLESRYLLQAMISSPMRHLAGRVSAFVQPWDDLYRRHTVAIALPVTVLSDIRSKLSKGLVQADGPVWWESRAPRVMPPELFNWFRTELARLGAPPFDIDALTVV